MPIGSWMMAHWGVKVYYYIPIVLQRVNLLIEGLEKNLNIKSNLRNKYNKWIIYIPVKEMDKVREIVGRHIHKSMNYKIGLK